MAASSETGHAKNVANAKLINQQVEALGAKYNPSNPKLKLANLVEIYEKAYTIQEKVNLSVAPYSLAVDKRERIFAPKSKKITKLYKAYRVTEGVTQAQLDDFMTISRKLKGSTKPKKTSETESEEEKKQYSTSQMSYDYRTNNYDLLISLLEHTPNYSPNEEEFQVQTLKAEKEEMLQSTKEVSNNYIPLNNYRGERNFTFYNSEDNLVDTYSKVKDYLTLILDVNSVEYKAIGRIKFKKVI
jgi:hypothetical protein